MKRNADSYHQGVRKKCAKTALDTMTRTPSKSRRVASRSIERFSNPHDAFSVNLSSSPMDHVRVHSQEDLSKGRKSLEYLIKSPNFQGSNSSSEEQEQYFKRTDNTSDDESSPQETGRVASQTPTPELHQKKCALYAKLKKSIAAERSTKARDVKDAKALMPKIAARCALVSYLSTSETSSSSSEDSDSDVKQPQATTFSRYAQWLKIPSVVVPVSTHQSEGFKVPVSPNACSTPKSCNASPTSSHWEVYKSRSTENCCSSFSRPNDLEQAVVDKSPSSPRTLSPFWQLDHPVSNAKEQSSPLFRRTPICDKSPDIYNSSPQAAYPAVQHLRRRSFLNLPNYDTEEIPTSDNLGFIDTHCHLDFLFKRADFKGTFSAYRLIHEDTFPKSFAGCVAVFCDPQTFSRKHVWENLLKERNVWGAFGCHPHMASEYNANIEKHLLIALASDKVVAFGEIGLDYSFKNTCNRDVQKSVFRRQLQLALDLNLPLVIHSRDSTSDTLHILQEMVPTNYRIHRHCFTGTWDEAEEWLRIFPNLYIGLTCLVTFPAAREVHQVARNIPLDRLLLETDAPYFLPRNVNRDKRWSHPGMAIHVAAQVAALRTKETLEDVLKATRKNTLHMYGI